MSTFFSESFGLEEQTLDDFGAFNISLVNDLPLFVDPFLLFNSDKKEYQDLHEDIIRYLVFLRDKAGAGQSSPGLLRAWYCFPEIRQNWLGFSLVGNSGSGLGIDFARKLHRSLHTLFPDFGSESITESSHLEKVCLISEGVGRDNISDFTTNLIIDHICRYTQTFALTFLKKEQTREISIGKAVFNYKTESWGARTYRLPWANNDYVLLTPKDMLTRDETWINKGDLIGQFHQIPPSIPDQALREQVASYFERELWARAKGDGGPTARERASAAQATILNFPQLVDYYIRLKERTGADAVDLSSQKVVATELLFVKQLQEIQQTLKNESSFYLAAYRGTYEESHARLAYLKDCIENKGGYKFFFSGNEPIQREKDLQILFRLVWFGTPSDVTTEANDGRGPVDFKISIGSKDKTLVEMKLAKNSKLEQNLQNQTAVYQGASDAQHAIKAIIFFSRQEEERALGIIDKLGLSGDPDVVLIDARPDNKPSGSKAKAVRSDA